MTAVEEQTVIQIGRVHLSASQAREYVRTYASVDANPKVKRPFAFPAYDTLDTGSEPTSVLASGSDVMQQLKQLGELRDAGVVTPEEFEAKKVEMLERI